jgi:hypothetical protein
MYLSFSPHLPVLNSNIKVTLNEEYELRNSSLRNYLHSSVTPFELALLSGTICFFQNVATQTAGQAVSSFIYSIYVVRFCEGRSELTFTLSIRSEI